MKNKIKDEEIDLIDSFILIWQNKIKIILITLISIGLAAAYYNIKKQKFVSITEIEPISIFEENLFYPYNSFLDNISKSSKIIMQNGERTTVQIEERNFKTLNKDYLQKLFLAKIRDNKIITKAINKFELIDKTKFKSDELYFDDIKRLALTLRIIPPEEKDKKKRKSNKKEIRSSWTIKFETYDTYKWGKILEYLNNEINKEIKNELINNFLLQMNTVKLINNFKLEDIEIKIKNSREDYEIEIRNRLAFLREQTSIARELGIEKNTLEIINNNSQSFVIQSNKANNPYYMRGYNMIDKEIDLINNRTDKDSFIKNMQSLKKQKRYLQYNQDLNRLNNLFSNTPINQDNFRASNIVYRNLQSIPSTNLLKLLILSSIIGLIFGIFFTLMSNMLKKIKKSNNY